jgi:CO/xanthine dehydrogenase Mo-binding subunit
LNKHIGWRRHGRVFNWPIGTTAGGSAAAYGLAHQLYAKRSPYAHADIRGIDASAALAMPWVQAVLTGADYAADGLGPLPAMALYKRRDGRPIGMTALGGRDSRVMKPGTLRKIPPG